MAPAERRHGSVRELATRRCNRHIRNRSGVHFFVTTSSRLSSTLASVV